MLARNLRAATRKRTGSPRRMDASRSTSALIGANRAFLTARGSRRLSGKLRDARHVRLWPKADIPSCGANVRFQGYSRHVRLRMSAFAVAIGGKADIAYCAAPTCL